MAAGVGCLIIGIACGALGCIVTMLRMAGSAGRERARGAAETAIKFLAEVNAMTANCEKDILECSVNHTYREGFLAALRAVREAAQEIYTQAEAKGDTE